jgi:hypothetical protein
MVKSVKKIIWAREAGTARFEGREFVITSDVRNELNGRRKLHDPEEVVNVVNADGTWGRAYMPRPFPRGLWKITGTEKTTRPVFAPVKIKTDAHQKVELWNLDRGGGYDRPSGIFADDWGYHLHWSEYSRTTLGCGRVGRNTSREVVILAEFVEGALKNGDEVTLEVV